VGRSSEEKEDDSIEKQRVENFGVVKDITDVIEDAELTAYRN
jgi:hypothetical protein